MLDYKYSVVSPFLYDISRLNALSSGYKFGDTRLNDEHHLEKLNSFISNLENPVSYDYLAKIRNREYPDLKREKSMGHPTNSDLLLKEGFRQHRAIEEKYRTKLPTVVDIRNISDPLTKMWKSGSRGYERFLVDLFNNLDAESFNRRSIKPLL
jgi:hypothetical protein